MTDFLNSVKEKADIRKRKNEVKESNNHKNWRVKYSRYLSKRFRVTLKKRLVEALADDKTALDIELSFGEAAFSVQIGDWLEKYRTFYWNTTYTDTDATYWVVSETVSTMSELGLTCVPEERFGMHSLLYVITIPLDQIK